MDPKDFFVLANELSKRSSDEASLRTSVGRSYYALHHYVSNFYLDHSLSLPPDASRHKKICLELRNCDIETAEDVAITLDNLRTTRNEADYDLQDNSFSNQFTALLALKRAEEACQQFESITSSNKKRNQLAKKIEAYRTSISGVAPKKKQ